MVSPALREILRPTHTTCWILWTVLTLSMGVYVLVAWLLAQSGGEPTEIPFLAPVLGLVAAVTASASLVLPRLLLSDERIRRALGAADLAALLREPRLGLADAERRRQVEAASPEERRLLALPRLHFTPFIVRLALNEAVVIYGLVLALLARSLEPMLPFAAAGIALNLLARPGLDALLERAVRLAPR